MLSRCEERILSPSFLATGLASSLDDTSLFTSTLEGREVIGDGGLALFLGGAKVEIFLTVGEVDMTVLGRSELVGGSELLAEVFVRLMIRPLIVGGTSGGG